MRRPHPPTTPSLALLPWPWPRPTPMAPGPGPPPMAPGQGPPPMAPGQGPTPVHMWVCVGLRVFVCVCAGLHGFAWVCMCTSIPMHTHANPCKPRCARANPSLGPPMALAHGPTHGPGPYPTTQPPHPPAAHPFWGLSNFLRIGGGSEQSADLNP